jgi:tetratricopeptide (TPR) repeat protein
MGGHNIFDLHPTPDGYVMLCKIIMALVFVALIFENLTDRLEARLADNALLKAVLGKIFKKLTVLGFVSFIFIIIQQYAPLSDDTFLLFELSHVLVFVLALLYALSMAYLGYQDDAIHKHWLRVDTGVSAMVRKHGSIVEAEERSSRLWHRLRNRIDIFRSSRAESEFVVLKYSFLHANLLLETKFDYCTFLHTSLHHQLVELVDVQASSWALVFALVLVAMVGVHAGVRWHYTTAVLPWLVVAAGGAMGIFLHGTSLGVGRDLLSELEKQQGHTTENVTGTNPALHGVALGRQKLNEQPTAALAGLTHSMANPGRSRRAQSRRESLSGVILLLNDIDAKTDQQDRARTRSEDVAGQAVTRAHGEACPPSADGGGGGRGRSDTWRWDRELGLKDDSTVAAEKRAAHAAWVRAALPWLQMGIESLSLCMCFCMALFVTMHEAILSSSETWYYYIGRIVVHLFPGLFLNFCMLPSLIGTFSVLQSTMQEDSADIFLDMHRNLERQGSYAQAADVLSAAVTRRSSQHRAEKVAASVSKTKRGSAVDGDGVVGLADLLKEASQLNRLAETFWRHRAVKAGDDPQREALKLLRQSLKLLEERKEAMDRAGDRAEFEIVVGGTLADVYQGLAATYLIYTPNRSEDARIHGLLEQALDLRQRARQKGKEAETLNSLGMLAENQCSWAQAEQFYQRSLDLRLSVAKVTPDGSSGGGKEEGGGEHRRTSLSMLSGAKIAEPEVKLVTDVGQSYMSLGNLLAKLERYQEALLHLRSATQWYELEYGKDHPKVCNAHEGIGRVLHLLGQLNEASECFAEAQRVRELVALQAQGRQVMQKELWRLYSDQAAVEEDIQERTARVKHKAARPALRSVRAKRPSSGAMALLPLSGEDSVAVFGAIAIGGAEGAAGAAVGGVLQEEVTNPVHAHARPPPEAAAQSGCNGGGASDRMRAHMAGSAARGGGGGGHPVFARGFVEVDASWRGMRGSTCLTSPTCTSAQARDV